MADTAEDKMLNAAFDSLKKEIRSLLISFKGGCTLIELRKEYKMMLGRSIPADKFGYCDDIDFLYDIPDVVEICKKGNEYILTAVADEATWHIQKMVANQKKPSKVKTSRSVHKYSQSSRYVPRSSSYSGSRSSFYVSKPSTKYPNTSASFTQSSGSRQPLAASNNFNWTRSGTSNQTFAPNSTPSAVRNVQSSIGWPSPIGSNAPARSFATVTNPTSIYNTTSENHTPVVSRQSTPISNHTPVVSRQSTPVSNRTPVVGQQSTPVSNYTPVVSQQSYAASNPSHFVSNSSPTQATSVDSNNFAVSNSSTASTYFSRQFKRDLPPRFRATSSTTLLPPEVEGDIVNVIRKYPSGLRMKDFFIAYQRNFNEEFSLEKHRFSTLQECLETIPDLTMRPSTNNDFLIFYEGRRATSNLTLGATAAGKSLQSIDSCGGPATTPFKKDKTTEIFKFNGAWANTPSSGTQAQSHNTFTNQSQNSFNLKQEPDSFNFQERSQTSEKPLYHKNLAEPKNSDSEERKVRKKADVLDNFELSDLKVSSLGLTEQMKNKFREIISRNKQGIQAKDFPTAYESVTGSQFDLHTLGYTNLEDLVDSLPDILHRRKVDGSRKDWLIIPAHGYQDPGHIKAEGQPKMAALQIECCIQNTRMILEAYPEGIPINDFLHIYSINCNEPLYIVDLGFDSIENFLLSISDRVPLLIKIEKGVKTIFLDKVKAEAEVDIHEEVLPESIPFDAASPDCVYKNLVLPLDIGTSEYIPVYTSEIISPGQIFIQLVGKDTSEALNKLSDDLELFYKGPNSDYYVVQERHLKEGAMCASQWPKDHLWYRSRIVSLVTPEVARVFYVDYGTSDVVPIALLRYLKETFSKLPAQAIKASLAHLKPPNTALGWNPEAKRRILQLCQDVLLMANVVRNEDGVLQLLLCDTNDNKDLFINDTLMEEGFAVSTQENPEPPQELPVPTFDAQHLIEAQCFFMTISSLACNMPPDQLAKTMANLALNYPNNPLVQKVIGCAGFSPGTNPYQSLLGTMPNQLPSGSAAYQPSLGTGAGQSAFGAIANQPWPASTYQSSSRIGTGQPPLEAMANQLPTGIGGLQSMLGTMSNQQFPVSYQYPSGISAVQPSFRATANNRPPGFSAYQSSAGIDAGQLAPGTLANQFPPVIGACEPSATVGTTAGAAAYYPQPGIQSRGSPDDESDYFEDDEDIFEEFLQKSCAVSKRFVKRIQTDDGYFFHILIVDGQPYVSSGDISSIIWCQKEPDYLLKRLQNKDTIFESQSISEEGNESMFAQFEQFHVKGIQRWDETACLIIYPLHSSMKILNEFGHPSLELRQQIKNVMDSFNPNLPTWQELSEMEIPESEETFPAITDEEKINRLCLYDLKCTKEGIRLKRDSLKKKLVTDPSKAEEWRLEMQKNENLNQRVELRIAYIQKVCSSFS